MPSRGLTVDRPKEAMVRSLSIPHALSTEFASVLALWDGTAETRAIDSLILTWVKYEKQTRRLFTFLAFQHPNGSQAGRDSAQVLITGNGGLFDRPLSQLPLPHSDHARLWTELRRIKNHRKKIFNIFHSQLTGHGLSAADLYDHVQVLVAWIGALACAAQDAFGHAGIRGNTCALAGAPGAPALSPTFGESGSPGYRADWNLLGAAVRVSICGNESKAWRGK